MTIIINNPDATISGRKITFKVPIATPAIGATTLVGVFSEDAEDKSIFCMLLDEADKINFQTREAGDSNWELLYKGGIASSPANFKMTICTKINRESSPRWGDTDFDYESYIFDLQVPIT